MATKTVRKSKPATIKIGQPLPFKNNKEIPHHVPKWLDPESAKKLNLMTTINRTITPSHVSKMVRLIQRKGMLQNILVTTISFLDGVRRTYILDGQNRYLACLRLGIGFNVVNVEIKDHYDLVETIAGLNNCSKTWVLADYIKSWGSLPDKQDYRDLKKYFDKYDLSYETLGIVFSGSPGSTVTDALKRGDYRIVNRELGEKILSDLNDIFRIANRANRWNIRNFVVSYARFRYSTPSYNHNKLLNHIEKNKNIVDGLSNNEKGSEDFFNDFV